VEPVTPALALASLKGSGVREIKNSATEHTESTETEQFKTHEEWGGLWSQ